MSFIENLYFIEFNNIRSTDIIAISYKIGKHDPNSESDNKYITYDDKYKTYPTNYFNH